MKLKELSAQITAALDKILPEDISCVFVLYDPKERDVCSAANIPDRSAIVLLQEAAETLKASEEVDEADELKIN